MTPVVKQYEFSFTAGHMALQFVNAKLTQADIDDLREWLHLVVRMMERTVSPEPDGDEFDAWFKVEREAP